MCFGGNDSGPNTNPAPYKPEDSQAAVSFEKTNPDGTKLKVPAQTDTQPTALTSMVGTGLNVKGM